MIADTMIMAGGRSLRMRERGDPTHKALVCLDGIPLVERSLITALAHGSRSIALAVNAQELDLIRFARSRLRGLAEKADARFDCIIETQPLGTIGAIARVTIADALLVLNVDNVTDLDLSRLVERHRSSAAAITIAGHREPFTMPFGELEIRDGAVCAYHEKPTHYRLVSSGTYVFSASAAASIQADEPIDVPEIFARVRARGLLVAAHEHDARWIDVNDAGALARAQGHVRPASDAPGLRAASR
jgi:NDP-sugar pyrophosphorylase family protein